MLSSGAGGRIKVGSGEGWLSVRLLFPASPTSATGMFLPRLPNVEPRSAQLLCIAPRHVLPKIKTRCCGILNKRKKSQILISEYINLWFLCHLLASLCPHCTFPLLVNPLGGMHPPTPSGAARVLSVAGPVAGGARAGLRQACVHKTKTLGDLCPGLRYAGMDLKSGNPAAIFLPCSIYQASAEILPF